MGTTRIPWAHRVWNPITGCSRISTGCRHCYAHAFAARLAGRCGYPQDNPFGVTVHEDALADPAPLHWCKPQRVFVGSMNDPCHKDVPVEAVHQVLDVAAQCPHLRFMFLTKRPNNLPTILAGRQVPLDNVWWGTSVENDEHLFRVADLVTATTRWHGWHTFISLEPLLGPVHGLRMFREYLNHSGRPGDGLEWVVAGGENAPGKLARPCDPAWVRGVEDDCAVAGVPFYWKGWGSWVWPEQYGRTCGYEEGAVPSRQGQEVPRVVYTGHMALDGRLHQEFPAGLRCPSD